MFPSRRNTLKGLAAVAGGTALARLVSYTSAFAAPLFPEESTLGAPRGERGPEHFIHPHLQAAPQWLIQEDGSIALWMLGRDPRKALRLEPYDAQSERLLAAAGVAFGSAASPAAGGVFLSRSDAAANAGELLAFARSAGRVSVTGLPQAFVRVNDGSDAGEPIALPIPTSGLRQEEFSFVFGSCIHPGNEARMATLAAMAMVKADFCFLLGDTTYFGAQDWVNEASMLTRWQDNRSLNAFSLLGGSKPLFSVWDDHDFGPNDATGDFQNKALSRKVFLSHFPRSAAASAQDRLGIHASFKIGSTRLVFLDDRTWRAATPWVFDNGGSYLGTEQFAWFQSQVAKKDYSRLIVAGGSQFFAHNPLKEVYRRHKEEFKAFTDFLQDTLEVPVVFLSGDIHMTEVTDLRATFRHGGVELTSSGIGNTPNGVIRKLKRLNDPLYLYDGGFTFGRLRVRAEEIWFDHFNAEGLLLAQMKFS